MSETQPDSPPGAGLRTGRNGRPITQHGDALRALRKKAGWRSQTTFASAVGISQGFLSAIEVEIDGASEELLDTMAAKLHVPRGALGPGDAVLRTGRNGRPVTQLGATIAALRELDNWQSQTEFAGAVGISQGFLSAIERDIDGPSSALLEAIARKLRVPVCAISRDIPRGVPQDAADPAA